MSARRATHVVILAAGLGKRMRSATIKILHPVAGRPMIARTLAAVAPLHPDTIVMVLGNQAPSVRAVVESEAERLGLGRTRLEFALQKRQLGTGHALLQAEPALRAARGDLLILAGDVPAIETRTLRRLLRQHRAARAAASVLTAELRDPTGYGRIVRGEGAERGEVLRIVEHRDADATERRLAEINTGIYAVEVERIWDAVRGGGQRNAQKEYYLTDAVAGLRARGRRVIACKHRDPDELMGVNDRAELARVGRWMVRRALERLMAAGVTVLDPERTDVEPGVRVGRDTVLHPGVTLEGETRVGRRCILHPGVRVHDSIVGDDCVILDHSLIQGSRVGRASRIGPMANLRPGTDVEGDVHLGNFVETKKTRIGKGSKANHLSYLGDAVIGRKVNVGAGTITCNYDGVHKHATVIDDGVFIGSDSQLVAPVRIGRGAYVGAGSTVVQDVPPGALALSRTRQTNKPGWADALRRDRELRAGRASSAPAPPAPRGSRGRRGRR
jgi:bifunctional UDP-N-acetylglucosamine pyrophosphorylase/glucosamine-1-phosphate N-acetyltransferase